MAARTNTNISWLDWCKFCSFIALVGESSRVQCHPAHPGGHPTPTIQPPPLENPARSQLVSQLQFTSISLRLLRFSLHTFWGGKWRELSLQLQSIFLDFVGVFESVGRVLGNCISFPAGFHLRLKAFPHDFQIAALLDRVTHTILCGTQHSYFC